MAGLGLLIPVLLLAAIVTGFYLWARHQGLVGDHARQHERRSGVSVLTEAVAYVGAILVLAGGITALGQRWDDISDWGHVGIFVGGAVLFLLLGVVLRSVADDAIQRLVSVLWFLSVGGVAGAVAFATHDVYDNSGTTTLLATGLAMTAYSAVLWLLRRHALQNAALFGSLIVAVCGVIAASFDSPTSMAFALSLWVLGLAWAALGWRRYVEPMWVAMPLGVVLALIAPSIGIADHGWLFAVALVTAGTFMAASVPLRNTPLLAVATVSMFGYLTAMLIRYFEDSLGVPAALAVTGLLILGLAVVGARLMRAARPAEQDSTTTPPTETEERPQDDLHSVP